LALHSRLLVFGLFFFSVRRTSMGQNRTSQGDKKAGVPASPPFKSVKMKNVKNVEIKIEMNSES
jgi:hypothetical protein